MMFISIDWDWYLEQGKLEIVFVRLRQPKINNYKWGSKSVVISKATHLVTLGRETRNQDNWLEILTEDYKGVERS